MIKDSKSQIDKHYLKGLNEKKPIDIIVKEQKKSL